MASAPRVWRPGVPVTVALSLVAGVATVVLAGAGSPLLPLAIVGLLGAAIVLLHGDLEAWALAGYVLVAPVAISKALAIGAGVYAPALEITVADVCLIVLVPLWLRKLTTDPRPVTPLWRRLRFAALAFFAWTWISAFRAIEPSEGILGAVNFSKYVLAFFVLAELVRTPRHFRIVLGAGAAGVAAQVGWAVLQAGTRRPLFLPGMKADGQNLQGYELAFEAGSAFRPSGFLQHPNFFADYLALVLPIAGVVVLLGAAYRGRIGRRVWWTALAVTLGALGALVLTLSRGGWLAAATAGISLLVLSYSARLVPRSRITGVALAGALVAVSVPLVYPTVLSRIVESDERSTESRLLMMEQATVIFSTAPVLGVGLQSYHRAADRYVPTSFGRLVPGYRDIITDGVVHNAYLVLMAERGLVGLGLLLFLYGTFLFELLRSRWRDRTHQAFGVAFASSLFALLALFNFDHFYLDSRPGIVWLLLGLVAGLLRMQTVAESPAGRPSVARAELVEA